MGTTQNVHPVQPRALQRRARYPKGGNEINAKTVSKAPFEQGKINNNSKRTATNKKDHSQEKTHKGANGYKKTKQSPEDSTDAPRQCRKNGRSPDNMTDGAGERKFRRRMVRPTKNDDVGGRCKGKITY